MICGLIGEHLPHSFSKEIHGMIGDYAYDLKELRQEELDGFLAERDFRAVNVTIPYKQAVIPKLDHVSENAREIGAVNTIVNRGGALWGYNTDADGLTSLIKEIGVLPEGRKVLILGTGGTSRTAGYVVRKMGASEVLHVSRTGRDGAVTYEEAASSHSDADILINTTPCGMYPRADLAPISLSPFLQLKAVIDVVYNPLRTRLVLEAGERGIPAEGGLRMLAAQAVRASEIFWDTVYPEELTDEICKKLYAQKENIVLIGMPASGKSTVARIIGKRLGIPAVDVDKCIRKKAGMEIPEIFARYGEGYFRDLESEVVSEISLMGGRVIATGGGTVLRPENVSALRRNGRLYMLDRPLQFLRPTSSRPLGDTEDKLRKLYKERDPVYRAAADEVITAGNTPDETADAVLARRAAHI